MNSENMMKCLTEVYMTISNLITECDIEKVFKMLVAADPNIV